jgi:flagellar motor switch protein FliN/FliY
MTARPEVAAPVAEPAAPAEPAEPLVGLDSAVFRSVQVSLRATLGQVTMSVEELLALTSGAIVKLDRMLGEPVELYLNETLVARGEVVAVDDNFAIRLLEVAPA